MDRTEQYVIFWFAICPPSVGQNTLTQVSRNATYPIIGRTAGSDWYQIHIGTTVGWVSALYVIARNTTNIRVVSA